MGVVVTLNAISRLTLEFASRSQKKKIDLKALMAMDSDNDGSISELEFTLYMLKHLKKVECSRVQ
jgi:hypothetical protein